MTPATMINAAQTAYDPLKNEILKNISPARDGVLDARALRYGLLPIWDAIGLRHDSVYVGALPASVRLTFRPFDIESVNPNESGGNPDTEGHTVTKEINPYTQTRDMELLFSDKGFVTFPELAALKNEELADEIWSILWRADLTSERYQAELGTASATIRLRDVREFSQSRIDEAFGLASASHQAAVATRNRIIQSLETGLREARRVFDEAVTEIRETARSGRRSLDVYALRAMYHLEESRPEHAQVEVAKAANTGLGREIAEGLAEALNGRSTASNPGVDGETVEALLSTAREIVALNQSKDVELEAKKQEVEAKDAEILELQKQLEESRKAEKTPKK